MKKLLSFILIISCCFLFVACSNENNNSASSKNYANALSFYIIDSWHSELDGAEIQFNFDKANKYLIAGDTWYKSGTYALDGNVLKLSQTVHCHDGEINSVSDYIEYSCSFDGTTLVLSNNLEQFNLVVCTKTATEQKTFK